MAQGENYFKQAVALAKSIKKTQSGVNLVAVITDQLTTDDAIDYQIDIGDDLAENSNWKIENRCKFYKLSPFDETVILDSDMLFLDDVSHWWEYLSKFEMLCTSKVKTYRNEWVQTSPYRKTFVSNELPNVYSAFTYFKKCETSKVVFDLVTSIVSNWDEWTRRYAKENRQPFPSIDLALAIAIKVLGIEDQVINDMDFPTFTHMKSGCQGWKTYNEDWRTHIGVYSSEQGIRLGNHLQSGILHYVDKNFLQELEK